MTGPEGDERELLKRLKAGNNLAFKYFYDKYSAQLYRRLKHMVQIDIVAQELLQDLFVKVWEKRVLIDTEQSFKSYLYRIAEHIVYDHHRKVVRQTRLQNEVKLNSTEFYQHIEEDIYLKEAQNMINDALDQLPAQQRLVFKLCKIDGKSYAEVSGLLGISTSAVNSHITRASKTIKAYIVRYKEGTAVLIAIYAFVK